MTGVLLSFHSFVPVSYKRSLVRSLHIRAIRLCSPEYLNAEFDFLFETLRRNAYPAYFISKNEVTT